MCICNLSFQLRANCMGRISGLHIVSPAKVLHILFYTVVSMVSLVCRLVEESLRFLPALFMICWSARSHLGPPEFDITNSTTTYEGKHYWAERILDSLRVIKFAKGSPSGSGNCSFCLSDFLGDEIVVELPECFHLFHQECLKAWLQQNKRTCPLCRSNLYVVCHKMSHALQANGSR